VVDCLKFHEIKAAPDIVVTILIQERHKTKPIKTNKMKNYRMLTGMFLLVALLSLSTVHAQEPTIIDISPKPEFPQVNAIDVNGAFTVILKAGETQKLEVETTEKFDDEIKAKVSDGTLKLSGQAREKGETKVIFTYVSLYLIKSDGASLVKTDGLLSSDELMIVASGASNMILEVKTLKLNSGASGAATLILKGEAPNHEAKISGAATLNALDLQTDSTYARVSGAGNAKVNASRRLSGQVSGAGDLSYVNTPENMDVEKSGAGDFKQIDKTDTTHLRLGSSKVLIIDEKDLKKPKKTRRSKFDGHWGGVELGINAFLTPANSLDMPKVPTDYSFMDLKLNKSIGVSLNLIESNFNLIRNKLGLVTGLGLEFNNYRFDNSVVLKSDSSRLYSLKDSTSTRSKLTVSYLNVPMILEFQTNSKNNINSLHIGVGVIGGLRLGSYTKMITERNGVKDKVKSRDDYYLNPFKYELTGRIGWGKVNLFVNYALSEMFKKNKGPEVYPVTMGISLLGW
jgi:hypothetical protein